MDDDLLGDGDGVSAIVKRGVGEVIELGGVRKATVGREAMVEARLIVSVATLLEEGVKTLPSACDVRIAVVGFRCSRNR